MSLLKSLKGLYKGWDGELIVKFIHWMYLYNDALHLRLNLRGSTVRVEAFVRNYFFLLLFSSVVSFPVRLH